MKNPVCNNANPYLRSLLMVLPICLLGLTGCSSVAARAENQFHAALIGKMDPHPNGDEDEDPVAANRDWYELID